MRPGVWLTLVARWFIVCCKPPGASLAQAAHPNVRRKGMPNEDINSRLDAAEMTSEWKYLEAAAAVGDEAEILLNSGREDDAIHLYLALAVRDAAGIIEDLVEYARQKLELLGVEGPKSWKRIAAEQIERLPDIQKFLHIARQGVLNFSDFDDRTEQARVIIQNFRKAHQFSQLNRKDAAVLKKFEAEYPFI